MPSEPTPHEETRSVVFDAEPLLIWIDNDPGAETVEHYLSDTYYGNVETYISAVNLTEVHYNCADRRDRAYATQKTTQLRRFGVEIVNTDTTWERAAELKAEYRPNFPLGDAFALATAAVQDRPLVVGPDRHWNAPEDDGYEIVRVP